VRRAAPERDLSATSRQEERNHVTDSTVASSTPGEQPGADIEHFDVIVIGAGAQGLCQLHVLGEAGLSVQCFEAGGGVGGTWYWNRYPGCGFDSASETYAFSFAEELLDEWEWKHYYSYQPEAEAYLNLVADRFNLRPRIQLNSRVRSAIWDEVEDSWEVELESGQRARSSFLIAAVGIFGSNFVPQFSGTERFLGQQFHTSRWPTDPEPNLAGKRVAIIGTGASGVQLTPHVAKQCAHLTVFQRTATYCIPGDNEPVDPAEQQEWKEHYAEIHQQMREYGIPAKIMPTETQGRDLTKEERLAMYNQAWKRRGTEKFVTLFTDLWSDRELLAEYSEFLKDKIRERFTDPELAEMVVPKNHLFQAKRVPVENGYYEALQQDNVSLVDVREAPIEGLTEHGIKTSDREYEFDVIIFATGFDNVTGSVTRVDIRGVDGQTLKDKWDEQGLTTYLGLTVAGFPNLFITTVPALGSAFPPGAERMAEFFKRSILYMRENGYTRIEPTEQAEAAWVEHHDETGRNSIFGHADYCWYIGTNIPGKKNRYLLYCNSVPAWHAECKGVLDRGFEGFDLRSLDGEIEPVANPGRDRVMQQFEPIEGAPSAAL
jgi:cyclohexanone monooxygenase